MLYVADRENHRVTKYALEGGRNGTPIGDGRGSGPRQLNSPNGVVADALIQAVYISDYENGRIQLWNEGGLGRSVETVFAKKFPGSPLLNEFPEADDFQLEPRSNDTFCILETR